MTDNIKFSKTSKIFDDNNFSRLLPVISKAEFLKKLQNRAQNNSNSQEESFLGKRLGKMSRQTYGSDSEGDRIELQRMSELIQSISIQGLYTNQIVNEIINVYDIGKSVKITYLKDTTLDRLVGSSDQKKFVNGNKASRVLNDISVNDLFSSDVNVNTVEKNTQKAGQLVDKLNNGEFCHTKNDPGLSVVQVLDPNLRACFNQSQEIDAFFNLISTLDITMAMPYVKADFIIPNRLFKENGQVGDPTQQTASTKNFITTSLNNFLFGMKYASEDNFSKIGKAINGDYNINLTPAAQSNGETRKIYERQHMNSAVFLAPQTMVNADIDEYLGTDVGDRKEGALIDKFRPFMTIMDLSFDVRPQKGFLFYKTATLNLMLYDKARMTEIAPFIKPELLNSHSSEITLEYGWQHNLGDDDIIAQDDITNRNPIAQFINSLKVVEKYVIVNSSYTINENGSVNISLSLAMKGPVQLRNTPMPADTSLDQLDTKISTLNDYLLNSSLTSRLGDKNTAAFNIYDAQRNRMTNGNVSITDLQYLQKALQEERSRQNPPYTVTSEITAQFDDVDKTITEAIQTQQQKQSKDSDFLISHFDFLRRDDSNNVRIHDSITSGKCNDSFVDKEWWGKYLETSNWNLDNPGKWISLGKILASVTGKMLCKTKKYNEIQLVFYNLNAKAIRASYLNIASIPVNLDDFEKYLGSIVKDIRKMSVETFLSAVLNRCVNQKAAVVYGLDKFFTFDKENMTQYKIDENKVKAEAQKVAEIKKIDASVKGAIIEQYYDTLFEENNKEKQDTNAKQRYLNESSIDITFKVPRVVMNFDSMQHETDPESSILRISFYDELDNPYESLTDVISSLQSRKLSNALSSISVYRTTKNTGPNNQIESNIKLEAKEIIHELIRNEIIILIDIENKTLPKTTILTSDNINQIKTIKINTSTETDIKTFVNIKQMFKSYMPSLTLGQTNSALLSGNITTNQDAKYATALLMRQDGSVINNQLEDNTQDQTTNANQNVNVISDLDASPLFVLPSQASVSIIGCPLVNFAQLIFLDFNTNTTIDNIYFINGIKHNISPGKFSTELTMVQNDLFTRYEAQSTTIKNFLSTLKSFDEVIQLPDAGPASVEEAARKVLKTTTIQATKKSLLINYFVKFNGSVQDGVTDEQQIFRRKIANGFNLQVTNNVPELSIQQFQYKDPQFWKYTPIKRQDVQKPDIKLTKMEYLDNDYDIQNAAIIDNANTLMDNFIKMLAKVDEKMIDSMYLNDSNYVISKVEINSGYRSSDKNTSVKGVSNSKHLTGRAIDFRIWISDVSLSSTDELLDIATLSKIILNECFNIKSEGNVFTNAADYNFTNEIKIKSSISVNEEYTVGVTPHIMVGGLGIYTGKNFIHYDIRDIDDPDRRKAVVWLDEDTATDNLSEEKEDNESSSP